MDTSKHSATSKKYQSKTQTNAARLIPVHLAGEELPAKDRGNAGYKDRDAGLSKAGDLDKLLRTQLKERGVEKIPQNHNLALLAIEEFRTLAQDAAALRKTFRGMSDSPERNHVFQSFVDIRLQMKEYLELGPVFEKAYRDYLQERTEYRKFLRLFHEQKDLSEELATYSGVKKLSPQSKLSFEERSRVNSVLRTATKNTNKEEAPDLRALECIHAPGSQEFNQASLELIKSPPGLATARTFAELQSRHDIVREGAFQLWQNPMVRYFWQQNEIRKLLSDISLGKDVLEDPQTVQRLNKLREWERVHQRTTVGGVIVGPPGTGKTTLIRHYLESLGRKYVYIDLSEDVTRYLLLGSKEIRFQSESSQYEQLANAIKSFDDDELGHFIGRQVERLKNTATLGKDADLVIAIEQVSEALAKGEGSANSEGRSETDKKIYGDAKERLAQFAEKAYHRELAGEFAHIVKRNGWRDGVVIAALRENCSLICDEFVHFKQWQVLNSLMTAKPGSNWHFADNNETIQIPKTWRMYFTANIGTRHGGFVVSEKMASRVGEMVMEVGYPEPRTELSIGIGYVCDERGNSLCNQQDLLKLCMLIKEGFPKIRALLETQHNTVPLSYRTLRTLAEKLVQHRDPESGEPVHRRLESNFERVLYDTLIGPYALYESNKVPTEIINNLTAIGLLLDDSVKSDVLKYLSEDEYLKRRETYADKQKDFAQIEATLRGYDQTSADILPAVF